MSFTVSDITNNNNLYPAPTSGGPVGTPQNCVFDVEGTPSTGTTSGQPEVSLVNNESELDKALKEVLGENYLRIKEEIKNILERLGFKIPKEHTKLTEAKINEIKEKVQALVTSLRSQNKEITAENLLLEARYQIDSRILERNGMTREDLAQAVNNGEVKPLRELLGLREGEEITEAKVIEFAKKELDKMMAEVKSSPNPEAALQEAIAKQKRQLALCLVATPEKDRKMLLAAVGQVFAQHRAEFINEILESISPEERRALTDLIDREKINAWLNIPDANGNVCTLDQKTGLIVTITQYQSAETIRENEEAFMAQAREFFARPEVTVVQAKIKNGEELTPDEQKIAQELDTYTAYFAGNQIGVANSFTLSEEARNELLQLLHNDSYELPNYRDVLTQMILFVENEENAEFLNISKEEFESLMNKVSKENYSVVKSDIEYKNATGETRESDLNAPKDPNAGSNAAVGYTTREGVPDYSGVNNAWAAIDAQNPNTNNDFVIVIDKESAQNTSNKGKNWTPMEIASDPIGYLKYCHGVARNKRDVLNLELAFNQSNSTIQLALVERTCGTLFNIFFNAASDSIINNADQGRTFAQTKIIKERQEEIREDLPIYQQEVSQA